MRESEKHKIRNQWCDHLCMLFKNYNKTGVQEQIRIPLYTAQRLSTFDILDYEKIDFTEAKINIAENKSRTNNENLIYACFDELIEKKIYINDYFEEFRSEFNDQEMPY